MIFLDLGLSLENLQFLEQLQGKYALDVVMKTMDFAEVQLEKAIIDVTDYSLNFINKGESISIFLNHISEIDKRQKLNPTIILDKWTYIRFKLVPCQIL